MAAQDADVGERVEALLARLTQQGGDAAAATGDDLVRLLVEYYGGGLERIVDIIGPEAVHAIAADPLVESQLILHGLHPLSVDERIEQALDRVRPYLGSHAGGVAYHGVDEDGVAHLSLSGSCNGCGSSTITVQMTIEEAVLGAAPEVSSIEVEGQVEDAKPLLQIGIRPGMEPAAPRWLHPSSAELPTAGTIASVRLDGRQIVMAKLADTYYAYGDMCAACGGSLAGATLAADILACPSCAARFNIRFAGRAVDGTDRQLLPLPLLDDVSGIRIALQPEAV